MFEKTKFTIEEILDLNNEIQQRIINEYVGD